MTRYLAKQAGFSIKEASIIAKANQGVDDNPSTTSIRNPFKKRNKEIIENWHFASDKRVSKLLNEAFQSRDLKKLGQALHVLQDSLYAHKGYRVPWGHWWTKAPDQTWRDLNKSLKMAQHTLDVLTKFRSVGRKKINKKHYKRFFNSWK